MDIMLPEFKTMLALLVRHNVNFMLIGGYAVIYHGYERLTTDLDIWLKPENENRDQLIAALREFGISEDSLQQLSKKDFKETTIFHFGDRPSRIDFLTKVNGVNFSDAEAEMIRFPVDNIQIPIIQYHHLILSKINNNREQDKADVEMLQKINQSRIKSRDKK